VPSGNRYSYPHTIDSGHGERITFLHVTRGPGGERLEVTNAVAPGAGPPMHVHHRQEEALTVEEGRMGYQRLGEAAQFAGRGETVTFKAGEAHKFWNAGDSELRCRGYVQPPDSVEYFLTELYDAVRRGRGGRPNMLDAAYLSTRYRSEFGMLEIPSPVQRFVFPILIAVGTLLGRYRRYEDAPQPVRR
jgi:uncharacterized cupin superfamily protein